MNIVSKHKINPTAYFCQLGDVHASILEQSVKPLEWKVEIPVRLNGALKAGSANLLVTSGDNAQEGRKAQDQDKSSPRTKTCMVCKGLRHIYTYAMLPPHHNHHHHQALQDPNLSVSC